MARITVEDCTDKIPNHFDLTLAAARRARQLENGTAPLEIVKTIGKNKRELNLPILLHLAHKFYTLFPKLADKLAGETFNYK